jgi:nucleotide-binding universal stress UspA family protein
MKAILLHANADAGQESRLQAALELARAHNGHVTCLQTEPIAALYMGDGAAGFAGAAAMAQLQEQTQQQCAKNRADLEAKLGREGVPWRWVETAGDATQSLLETARLHDVIVLSLADKAISRGERLPLIGDVALASRAPILAVPTSAKKYDPLGTALVAWNGSHEAANAVRAALPLLQKAAHVVVAVVQAVDPASGMAEIDVCAYLSLHGIKARAMEVEDAQDDAAAHLVETALSVQASTLVMGAYGHSRLREYLLGGVTRSLLSSSPIPLLLAH